MRSRFEGDIFLNQSLKKIEFLKEGVLVHLSDRTIRADHLISTIPATALSSLIMGEDKELGFKLQSLPSSSIVSVQLGFKKFQLKRQGFGYLIPQREKEPILGTVFDSSLFPEQSSSPQEGRMTVMMGGSHNLPLISLPKEKLKEMAIDAVQRHLNPLPSPDFVSCHLHPHAIPQYHLGHLDWVEEVQSRMGRVSPHVTLLGSSFYGVSVNDCIAQAKQKSLNLKLL